MKLSEYEEGACQAAHRAGEVLRRAFRNRPLRVERKGPHDFVTEIDHEAEEAIVGYLRSRFPNHGILAEESSPMASSTTHRWIVDPLDGTTNFIHGVPVFAVSIALEDPSGLAAAAVYDPIHDETFHAARGGGARRNGKPIECTRPERLDDALLATGFPFRELSRVDGYLESFKAFIHSTAGIRRAGSASIDLAFTACGRYDGFWEIGLSTWDVAAGALLVREAGGVVTDIGGDPEAFLASGDILAAGPALHREMLKIVKAALKE